MRNLNKNELFKVNYCVSHRLYGFFLLVLPCSTLCIFLLSYFHDVIYDYLLHGLLDNWIMLILNFHAKLNFAINAEHLVQE